MRQVPRRNDPRTSRIGAGSLELAGVYGVREGRVKGVTGFDIAQAESPGVYVDVPRPRGTPSAAGPAGSASE
jgi:hypothetical protein